MASAPRTSGSSSAKYRAEDDIPAQKKLSWFERWILRRKPPKPPSKEFADAGVNTTEYLLDKKKIRQALAVTNLAAALNPQRKVFSAWSTTARELRSDRLQYYGEELQALKNERYEVRLLELRRERDALRDQVEELKMREDGSKFLLIDAEKVKDGRGTSLTNSDAGKGAIAPFFPGAIVAEQAVAPVFPRVPEEEDRPLWTAPRRIVDMRKVKLFAESGTRGSAVYNSPTSIMKKGATTTSSAAATLLHLKLSGPLRLEIRGDRERAPWQQGLTLLGRDCHVRLFDVIGLPDIDIRSAACLELTNCDVEGTSTVRSGGRFFAKQSFLREDVIQYDCDSSVELLDSNVSKRVRIMDGFVSLRRCKFLEESARVVLYVANSSSSSLAVSGVAPAAGAASPLHRSAVLGGGSGAGSGGGCAALDLFLLVLRRWWLLAEMQGREGEEQLGNGGGQSPRSRASSPRSRVASPARTLRAGVGLVEHILPPGQLLTSPRRVTFHGKTPRSPSSPTMQGRGPRGDRQQADLVSGARYVGGQAQRAGAKVANLTPHPALRRSCLCCVEQCWLPPGAHVLVKGRGCGLFLDAETAVEALHLQDGAILVAEDGQATEHETELPADRLWSLSPTRSLPHSTAASSPGLGSPPLPPGSAHNSPSLNGSPTHASASPGTMSPRNSKLAASSTTLRGLVSLSPEMVETENNTTINSRNRTLDTSISLEDQLGIEQGLGLTKHHKRLPHVRGDRTVRFLGLGEALGLNLDPELVGTSSKMPQGTAEIPKYMLGGVTEDMVGADAGEAMGEGAAGVGGGGGGLDFPTTPQPSFEELMRSCKKHTPKLATLQKDALQW